MIELPHDFSHQPPAGYRYETVRKNASTVAIWTVYERGFNYCLLYTSDAADD